MLITMLQLTLACFSQFYTYNAICSYRWLNVKTAYLRRKFGFRHRYPYTNLTLMLEDLGQRFEGREHSGIDDARNLMRLYKRLDDLGCNTFELAIEN